MAESTEPSEPTESTAEVAPVEPAPEPVPEPSVEPSVEPVAAPSVAPVAEPTAEDPPAQIPAPPLPTPLPTPASAREVVYVQAPTPPTPRHNRGFAVIISVLGTVAFGLLYLAVGAIIIALTPGVDAERLIGQFGLSAIFWVPIASYLVFSIAFVLIVNRAAWWSHVLGSLFVAILSYAASLGILALANDVINRTPEEAALLIGALAVNPFLIAALVLAREASLWFGLAISARGRRVKERNAADRAAFEQTVAERRAEYERAHPAS